MACKKFTKKSILQEVIHQVIINWKKMPNFSQNYFWTQIKNAELTWAKNVELWFIVLVFVCLYVCIILMFVFVCTNYLIFFLFAYIVLAFISIHTGVFTCIMAVYNIKDSVSTCKHWKARIGTCVKEKHRWLHPKFDICVPYFWSG